LTGDWESWLDFFADAVIETAEIAVETARSLARLAETDRQRINTLGRSAGSALRVQQAMLEHPVVSSGQLVEKTGMTAATVNAVLLRLAQLGVVSELSGQQRNRLYSYTAYINLMNQGTEPLGWAGWKKKGEIQKADCVFLYFQSSGKGWSLPCFFYSVRPSPPAGGKND
jgi:cell filamentation protein, protein adenylyltransferase